MPGYVDPPWLRKAGLGASLALHAAIPALLLLLWWLQPPSPKTPPMPNRGVTLLTMLPASPTPAAQPAPAPAPEPRPADPVTPTPPAPRQAPTQTTTTAPATLVPDAAPTPAAMPAPASPAAAAPVTTPAAPDRSDTLAAPAPAASSTLGTVDFPIWYLERMSKLINRRLEYPASVRLAGQSGTALVRVRLARNGAVLEAALQESSGHRALDAEARNVVLRIGNFKPVPQDVLPQQREFVIHQPVEFALRR